jgi:hypothetical protein
MDVDQRVQWMKENSKETYEEAKECMRTNYYGAKLVTEALLPLLQLSSCGRIVNVSSGFALLRVSIADHSATRHDISVSRITFNITDAKIFLLQHFLSFHFVEFLGSICVSLEYAFPVILLCFY